MLTTHSYLELYMLTTHSYLELYMLTTHSYLFSALSGFVSSFQIHMNISHVHGPITILTTLVYIS